MAVGTDGPNKVIEEFNGPVSTYQVVEAKPLNSDQRFVASDLDSEEVQRTPAVAQRVSAKVSPAKIPVPKVAQPLVQQLRKEIEEEQLGHSSTKMYVAL